MSQNNNSITDLQPLAEKVLSDKQWHCLAEVLKEVGTHIMPERAVRFYQGQGGGAKAASREEGDSRPLDERIRAGRRRGVYLVLKAMINRGMAECKNNSVPPDEREFRLVYSLEDAPPRSPPRPKRQPISPGSLTSMIDDLQDMFSSRFKESRDHGDFRFHCRHLRRIVALNEKQQSPRTDAPGMSQPDKE